MAALLAHIQWLLMASVCIATGEFVECTYYISILLWAHRTGRLTCQAEAWQRQST
jgi:hypothetical protein